MTRQPGHLNGSKNKNFRGSNENWRTGSTCVGFSKRHRFLCRMEKAQSLDTRRESVGAKL